MDYFAEAIAEYLGPNRPSLNSVATKFGIPETSLRREIKRRGLFRGTALALKRQMVDERLAGETGEGPASGGFNENAIAVEAAQDIEDMSNALTVCRKALVRLIAIVDALPSPRDIKTAVDAASAATTTIRRIRGLDAPSDFSDWTVEELEYLARTGREPRSRLCA